MIQHLLTKEEAKSLILFHKAHRNLETVGDGSDYVGIRFLHIKTQWVRDLIFRCIYDLVGEIKLTSRQTVWPEMISLNEWPIGGIQDPHLDTYSNQETKIKRKDAIVPAREWTCILYLNDDFKGGRTYIPDGETFEPETGTGLLFQGIYIPHGVSKVRRNSRHTISFWFSTDPDKQMIQHPIHNLDLDEDSVRL